MTRGWLWLYWRSANPERALAHQELLVASTRLWRAYNPNTDAVIWDLFGELPPDVLRRLPIPIMGKPPTRNTWRRSDINKLLALSVAPWDWTAISDLDVLWLGNTDRVWHEGATEDPHALSLPHFSGIGYPHHGSSPCDCVLVCRSLQAAKAALGYALPTDRGSEPALARAKISGAISWHALDPRWAWYADGLRATPPTVRRVGQGFQALISGTWQPMIGLHCHSTSQLWALGDPAIRAYLDSFG
jgi:hypothetical protein